MEDCSTIESSFDSSVLANGGCEAKGWLGTFDTVNMNMMKVNECQM